MQIHGQIEKMAGCNRQVERQDAKQEIACILDVAACDILSFLLFEGGRFVHLVVKSCGRN
jgi:hypothetical protein